MAMKRKTRMYEPWGYIDENNYQGAETILDNDLESFFAEVEYKREDNKIHFANKDGEEKATLDVSEFVKSDSIVEKAWYEDGKIYVKFTNGDVITVDVEELIDQNEFSDGLQVNEGIVSVLIDGESEAFLSVSGNGVKVSGVQDAIDAERDRAISAETALDEKIEQEIADRKADVDEEEARAISAETALDEKIDAETARATEAEAALDEKIDAEIERAEAAEQALDEKIEAETARATGEEARIEEKLDNEITRATQTEQALDNKINTLSDSLASEVTRAQAAEQELSTRLTTEVADRKADVDEEEARAKAAEEALDAKIEQEIADRINAVENEKEAREAADNRLQEAITSEVSRATEAETQLNNKIDAEIADREADVNEEEARAKAAEEALDAKIDDEIARAEAAEQTLQDNIDAEETARINRDTELTGLIEAEVVTARREETRIESKLDAEIDNREADVDAEETRAKAAETALDEKIDQEIANRKAEAVASAEYVKNDVKIYLKNDNGETLSEIDCTDFIVDGMIEDVELVESGNTSVLVITWNTDGGSKETTIDVGDIFEADNYYTKAEIDGTVEGINDAIAAEAATARAAEQANADAISAEATRATGAEGNLQTAINDEATARADADTALQGAVSDEATAREAADTALETAISDEQTRAEGAESNLQTAITAEAATARAAEQANANAIVAEKNRAETAEALKANSADVEAALELKADKTEIPTDFYTKGEIDGKENALQAGIDANADAIELKADKADVYTQEEVNVMMSQLLTRIKNLEEKESIVVADTAAEVAAAPAGSNVVIASTEAIQALTAGTEYSSITIVGGNANNGDIKAKATDKLTIDGMTINGDKGASNGRVLISANTIDLKNVTIETGSTAYNVFEGTQDTANTDFFTSSYNVSNMTVDNTELNHNVLNIYTPADDAVINVKDSYFNLHPEKSNVLRLANYTNATGVTVNFENINWTYENGGSSDFGYAGLIIYQPAVSDVARTGDTSKIATWTFNFKNCKYNGEVVDSVNFGEHNQVIYGYGINGGGVSDLSSIATVNFE